MNPLLIAVLVSARTLDSNAGMAMESSPASCAALVAYSEARSEGLYAQAVVASVLVERSRRSGRGICEEAMATDQFHGLRDWPLPRRPQERDAWESALQVAAAVVSLDYVPPCRATHMTDDSIKPPAWTYGMVPACEVGRLRFWLEPEKRAQRPQP